MDNVWLNALMVNLERITSAKTLARVEEQLRMLIICAFLRVWWDSSCKTIYVFQFVMLTITLTQPIANARHIALMADTEIKLHGPVSKRAL